MRARTLIPFFCAIDTINQAVEDKKIQVGGQAVIEGVMMRSQTGYSVAVRRRDGSILVRVQPFASLVKRSKLLALPILRGAVVLIESV
ncbi:MAG: hypothetical protein D6743_05730, partial [Calditrichaeota bacterium]